MRNRIGFVVVAALAAGATGIVGCSSTSQQSGAEYRLTRGAEGGNAPHAYNYVRTDGGGPQADAPYALAGSSDRPTRYKAVANVGGNARAISLVPQAD